MRRKNDLAPENNAPKLIDHNLSFDEAIELFIKEQLIVNRAPRTIEWHRENFNVFKKAFREQNMPLNLKTITEKEVKDNFILYALQSFGNQPSTVNNRLKTLKAFWNFLYQEGYVKTNIIQNIKKLSEKKKVIATLETFEIEAMFKACNKKTFTGLRDLTIMKTLLDTGARLKELSILNIEDLYFQEDLIKLDGKGRKERFVPLSPDLKKALKVYLNERGKLPVDEVFVTLGNRGMARRSIQDRISFIAKKAGIKKRSSPHTWRHTFAKLYIINGGDPFSLKNILGHSDWAMVHRYVNMFSKDVKNQHQKFSPLKNL